MHYEVRINMKQMISLQINYNEFIDEKARHYVPSSNMVSASALESFGGTKMYLQT